MCAKNNVNINNTENGKEKRSARHKPPSRKRYEKNNPVWTVRMPLLWHEDYERYVKRSGINRREFMGVSLEKIKLDYEQIRTQAYNEGFENGCKQGYNSGYNNGYVIGKDEGRQEGKNEGYKLAQDHRWIEVFCSTCRRRMEIYDGSWTHQNLIDFLIDYGWKCMNCLDRGF